MFKSRRRRYAREREREREEMESEGGEERRWKVDFLDWVTGDSDR